MRATLKAQIVHRTNSRLLCLSFSKYAFSIVDARCGLLSQNSHCIYLKIIRAKSKPKMHFTTQMLFFVIVVPVWNSDCALFMN